MNGREYSDDFMLQGKFIIQIRRELTSCLYWKLFAKTIQEYYIDAETKYHNSG